MRSHTRAKISTTAVTRLTGRKFETWMTQLLPGWARRAAQRRASTRRCTEQSRKVRDDADVAIDAELAKRVRLEALRHGGDAVGLLDAERDDFGIRRVAAEQRDVGAVQRRDDATARVSPPVDARICRAR